MGLKSTLLLNNLNSSLNLIFIRRIEEVKELKIVQNNDNVEFDDESDLQWSVEPSNREEVDHRSDDVESQKAINLRRTDICKEMCWFDTGVAWV